MKRAVNILFVLLILFPVVVRAQLRLEGIKREALKHIKNGRYGEAIDQLNKFIAAEPRNPEGYYLRGLCRENRQEYAYGREDYRKAIKLDNNFTEARKALERLKRVWYEILYDKIEGHKRDIAVNPDNPFYYLEIGKAYRWLEEWEMAEKWYDKYLARDINASPDEIIRYTLILTETGHIYKGWLKLKEYTERYPGDWRLWSRYGWFSNWLAKYKIAEKAFLRALAFKPFFKEAQDGLDVARRQAYVTIYTEDYNGNDRAREYPIDKYYRIVKYNPDDDESRFRLVNLLIEKERYEEAYSQLSILKEKHEEEERFNDLWVKVDSARRRIYEEKITKALNILAEDKFNPEATIKLAQYYRGLSAYEEAEKLLKDYLSVHNDDTKARYLLSKVLSENGMFEEALQQADTLLQTEPDNLDYKLLAAQLNIWSGKDLDLATSLLKDVIYNRPNDQIALIAAGTLNFEMENFNKAEEFMAKAEAIDPTNTDLLELKTMIEMERIRQDESKYMLMLDEGREIAKDGDCEGALPYFEKYLSKYKDNYQIKEEYASMLVCADRFDEAIGVYDKLLDEEYDLELDKMRAKIYYWSGDSLKAYDEFKRLTLEDPEDMEIQLYLADVNVRLGNYQTAKDIYLSLKEKAPESYLIEQRLDWLPLEYHETTTLGRIFGGITNYIFSFMNLNPFTSYFNDNLGFEYYYYGAQFSVGFTRYVSLGATYYNGAVNNTSVLNGMNFTTLKWNVFVHPMKNLSLSFGLGRVKSPNKMDVPTYDANITYNPSKNLNASLRYEHTDGVFQLYANELIDRRIPSNNLRFDGNYSLKSGLMFKTYYSLIWTNKNAYERENIGNIFNFRIGKIFSRNITSGYEYDFEDFKYESPLYYTPQVFVSHSLWGEWKVYRDRLWNFKIGGKIGYIPNSDYIVRELTTEISYNILENLRLLARGFLGSSIQRITAYSSGSFYMNLFWTIY